MRIELGSLDSKSNMLTTTPSNLLNLMLVFCLIFRDKRSTFSRESERRRNYTGVFLTMKKRFYRELTRVFGIKVQGANHYTIEPIESCACVFVEVSRQAFHIF